MKRFMDLMGTICMVLGFTVAGFFVFESIFVMRNSTMQEVVLAYGFQTCSALLVLSLVEFKIS
ncbi:MAG: hypothetical protein JWO43_641, partial [Candidatus Adlerbacteria bacterium]|nr:hypothetical protein [Candidatus Adlerbacteria bacterium]